MSFKDFAIAVAGPEAEQVAAGRRERRAMDALGSYLGKGDESALGTVYANNPEAGFRAEGLVQGRQDRTRAAVGNMVRFLDQLPPEQKAQGYAALVPQLQKAFPGQPIPTEYGPEVENALVQVRTLTAGGNQTPGGRVQSTYVNGQGQRVAIMADGTEKVLGENDAGMANQSIEVVGPDGRTRRVTFNKRSGVYEDPDYQGGGQPAPVPTPRPQPASVASPTPQMDSLAPIANAMIKAGIPAEQVDAFLMNAASNLPGVQVGTPTMEPAVSVSQPAPQPGASPFVSRTPEEQAAATERAKRDVGLDYASPEADAQADAARKKKEAELLAERNANTDKRTAQAQDTITTLTDVINLLPNATGSSIGAARDAVLAVGGLSTTGAQAASQLRLLSAKLIANVPRFEGPQSNIDVKFYREAAGDLANERLPTETRLAAAQRMLQIAEQYVDGQTASSPDEDALIEKYL